MAAAGSAPRLARAALALAGAALGALALAGPASAIPWDQQGAVPPAQTPPADTPDPHCGQSYANDAPKGGRRIEFGIGPRLAGEVGGSQTTPLTPENAALRDKRLRELRGHRRMGVRLNRLFEADGEQGIRDFKRMAHHYGSLGFDVAVQVRYHPTPAEDGDIPAWLDYVRRVVDALGPNRHVTALQITNEVNLSISPNTSDGAYQNAIEALAKGVPAAKREARRRGYDQLTTGFNYAWRSGDGDADFWRNVAAAGGRPLHRATDWIGLDAYPGTFIPPSVQNPGDALLEALAQVRECYMPLGGFGRHFPIHVEELGYPTGPGRSEDAQAASLSSFMTTINRYRGTYGIRKAYWFGLRDNNSSGPNFQSFFGLLRDDYSPKPAFDAYRRFVHRHGARQSAAR